MKKYGIALLITYLVCSKLNAQNLQTVTQTGNTTNRLIQITAQGGVPATGAGLELYSSNGGDGNIGGYDRGTGQPTNLRISQGGGNTYINPASGNVGVGTYNPLTKLHVNGSLTSNTINLNEGTIIGFLSRGISVTSGWSATPDVSAVTYFQRDFAIGGWAKSNGTWKGASIYINSDNGNVLIGKTSQTNTGYKLDINGNARANKVVVNTTGADFVFDSSYNLRSLDELESFIRSNHHLPEIAPAADMQTNGIDLGDNQTKLLQKTEELTLYLIEQNKQLKEQLSINTTLNKKIDKLTEQNQQLTEQVSEIEALKQLIAKQQEAIKVLQLKVTGNKD